LKPKTARIPFRSKFIIPLFGDLSTIDCLRSKSTFGPPKRQRDAVQQRRPGDNYVPGSSSQTLPTNSNTTGIKVSTTAANAGSGAAMSLMNPTMMLPEGHRAHPPWRLGMESHQNKGLTAATAILVAGIASAFWMGFQDMLGKH
jgi:hypothetical protein